MERHALDLYDYHVWANEKVFKHLKELPDDIFHQELQSVFPSISAVVSHIYLVDQIWFAVMSGKSYDEIGSSIAGVNERVNGRGPKAMAALFAEAAKERRLFLTNQKDLDASMTIHHPEFGSLDTCLSELVQHVVNHGTYHRGNISAMLNQLGYKGVPTDYIFYLYEK